MAPLSQELEPPEIPGRFSPAYESRHSSEWPSPPTVSELYKAKEVTDQEVDTVVDAVLADLATEAYPLAKRLTLDLVQTLQTNTRLAEAFTAEKPS